MWRILEHPRTALILGLILTGVGILAPYEVPIIWAFVVWAIAAVMIGRSAWAWAPIGDRVRARLPGANRRRRLSLLLEPSNGPSPDVRLSVTNQGSPATLRATCRILGQVNDPNPMRAGAYAMRWVESNDVAMDFERWHQANLLVARFQGLNIRLSPSDQALQADLIEWTAAGDAVWSGFRWVGQPNQTELPEFMLDITISGNGASWTERFVLGPENWHGPLQLIRLAQSLGLP